jgi:lysophospholipase L1-like esterase
MKKKLFWVLICLFGIISCSNSDDISSLDETPSAEPIADVDINTNNDTNNDDSSDNSNDPINYKIISLGDSYTIGQSVCETCKFPIQLKDSLFNTIPNSSISVEIIAQTGWTTSNLIAAIDSQNLPENNDLVTLLIGVNNQYQNKPFELYEQEFPALVNTAISLANGNSNKVIVVSIPDYAYTPFGQASSNPFQISTEIDQYNNFAKTYCDNNNISFINITDITREGLVNLDLVASDNLHPSELAYTKFVERILPVALEKIQ